MTAWIFIFLLIAACSLILLVRIPYVQNQLIQRVVHYLENKIGTPVTLKSIYISFPNEIILSELYLQDQKGDTLANIKKISIDTDLFGLLRQNIDLNKVKIEQAVVKISRLPTDSLFNYEYIVEAFQGNQQDTTGNAWTFNVGSIQIALTKLEWNDHFAGTQIKSFIGALSIDISKLDVTQSNYQISTVELVRSNFSINTKQGIDNGSVDQSTEPAAIAFGIDKVHLNTVSLHYSDQQESDVSIEVGDLVVLTDDINVVENRIIFNQIALENSNLSIQDNEKEEATLTSPVNNKVNLDFGWDVQLQNLTLSNISLDYDNRMEPTVSGLDMNHVSIRTLDVDAHAIEIASGVIKADVDSVSFHEQNGFQLKTFQTSLMLSDTRLVIEKLKTKTLTSSISLTTQASFPSLSATPIQFDQVRFDIQLDNSFISLEDVLFFAQPSIERFSNQLPDRAKFFVTTDLKGMLNDLSINHLRLNALDSTHIQLSGRVSGLSNWREALFDLVVDDFTTKKADVKSILPDSLIPTNINLPSWMSAKGVFRGKLLAANTQVNLESSIGKVDVSAQYDLQAGQQYDASLWLVNFDLGELLSQELLSNVTMNASLKGTGMKSKDMNAELQVTLDEFLYNHYTYKDFKIKGNIQNSIASMEASIEDENIAVAANGTIDFHDLIPIYHLNLKLNNADFKVLNFTKRPLKARGTLMLTLATDDFKSTNGTAGIRNVAIYNGKTLYKMDSMIFVSIDHERESAITIRSDILSGDFTGTLNIFSLPKTLRQHVNQYFTLSNVVTEDSEEAQQFSFDLTLKDTKLLTGIIFPELEPFIPGKIQGEFDSESKVLSLNIELSKMQYASIGIDSSILWVRSDSGAMRYGIRFKKIAFDTLHVDALELSGKLARDTVSTSFIVRDSVDNVKYHIGLWAHVIKGGGLRLHLIPDQVLMNYQPWIVPADNQLVMRPNELITQNVSIAHQGESIALRAEKSDQSLNIHVSNFKLSNLTQIISGVIPASGIANGELKFSSLQPQSFHSTLTIAQFKILEKKWGDFMIHLDHEEKTYGVELRINGDSLNVTSSGSYKTETKELELNVSLLPFKIDLLEPLSFGQLTQVSGLVSGDLNFHLSSGSSKVRGDLTFNNAFILPKYLNSPFTLVHETIVFSESGIQFNDFEILDLKKNKAIVNGSINTTSYRDYDFKLKVNSEAFQVMNTKKGSNSLYYGLLRLNSKISITGSNDEPVVDMTVTATDDSELTYIVPAVKKNVLMQEGIIQFVDKDATSDLFLVNLPVEDTASHILPGVVLNANIDLNEKSIFNIVIDPATEDKLSVSGNGSLVLDRDASGNITLSGRYEIINGSYNFFFYKLVKRQFEIEKGSSITWSGDPLNAAMDIVANYEVQASPLDLVYNQISATNQSELSSYGKRLPFIVRLSIAGKLLVPDITFAITMPENNRNIFGGAIFAKLQDINSRESDLNKQVFALLILRRFITDNPFESQSITSASNAARVSVSRMLSEQFNRLSENIKGVQLDFDLRSYENFSGDAAQGQTRVQLGVTKNLFNDRLVVKLSGNVDIEGDTGNGNASDYIGDLTLEYKLTRDGRFRISAFRLSNYDIIDGELTETGTGLIYIKDYDTLRQLFRSTAK